MFVHDDEAEIKYLILFYLIYYEPKRPKHTTKSLKINKIIKFFLFFCEAINKLNVEGFSDLCKLDL